jgi:hypothetical protein
MAMDSVATSAVTCVDIASFSSLEYFCITHGDCPLFKGGFEGAAVHMECSKSDIQGADVCR